MYKMCVFTLFRHLQSSALSPLIESLCYSRQAAMSMIDPEKLARRLQSVKHILLVLSGKGGVGKSSMSVQLALSLLAATSTPSRPAKIGLLDIDLTGPSIPRMLGLDGQSVHQSNDGWVPVYLPVGQQQQHQNSEEGTSLNGNDEFKVMSIGFLLKNSRQAVVWRGPKKSAMIRQFLADVRWGELDWLVVDTPPGESDPSRSAINEHKLIYPCFSQALPTNTSPFSRIYYLLCNPLQVQPCTLSSLLLRKPSHSRTYRKNYPSRVESVFPFWDS